MYRFIISRTTNEYVVLTNLVRQRLTQNSALIRTATVLNSLSLAA
jgi:hypothetical protein